jgi:replicative DNA helicase
MKVSKKSEYLNQQFIEDQKLHSDSSHIKTGFHGIDANMIIRPGIYLMGGLPSVGKTSLALQLADQIAMNGNHVLFFSLEQSEYDLTVKSINRIQSQLGCSKEKAIIQYQSFADRITTITTTTSITDVEIAEEIDRYVQETNNVPVIFIDYLQLIQAKGVTSKKDIVEHVSGALVNVTKKHMTTMFVLSSLNRANYMAQIDFESFKESGSLEYDADVVFGLQYQLLNDEKFLSCSSIDRKRILLNEAKIADVREVELVCLKNRFGPIIQACKLSYFTSQDRFVDVTANPKTSKQTVQKF